MDFDNVERGSPKTQTIVDSPRNSVTSMNAPNRSIVNKNLDL